MRTFIYQLGNSVLFIRLIKNNVEVERYRLEKLTEHEREMKPIFKAELNPDHPAKNVITLDGIAEQIKTVSPLVHSRVLDLVLKHQIQPWGEKGDLPNDRNKTPAENEPVNGSREDRTQPQRPD